MQGLDKKRHQSMEKAIGQYEDYSIRCREMIPEDHDGIIRKNISEFKGTYDYYLLLLEEIEECIGRYNGLHESLQKMVFPYARKMQGELRKKSFLK